MSDLTRAMLDDLLPPGPLWEPEEEADFDLLLDGIGDNYEIVRLFLSALSDIRNPNKTTILDDLEREYGIPTNTLLSEATRRQRLAELAFGTAGNGTEDDLQTALRNVGFDVYVYQNDPAVDPAIFLDQQFQMVAGAGNAYAGRSDAFAARTGGELLVNGEIFLTSRIFTSGAGSGLYAGTGHGAGEYTDLLVEKQEYPTPTDPNDWPLVFFVGGAVTYGSAPELAVNGGFETGDFTAWEANSSTIDTTNPAAGTYCAKLIAAGVDLLGATTQLYDISSSKEYVMTLAVDIPVYISGDFIIELLWFDSSDILINTTTLGTVNSMTAGYIFFLSTLGFPSSGAQFISPKGASQFKLRTRAENTPNFTAYIDIFLFSKNQLVIDEIENAIVPGTREDEFKRIILNYKPLHSWAALIVNFA